jgi:putative flippase GtrA
MKSSRLLRFCVVGSVGFVADAAATMFLTQASELSAFKSRVLAFIFAASITWALNRRYTFGNQSSVATFLPYLLLTSAGAFVNVSVYLIWLRLTSATPTNILLGVGFGSIFALSLNYIISKHLIFRPRG